MIELKPQSATATPDTEMEMFETYAGLACESQRGVLWWIGDLARMAERRWPNTWQQVFPEWMSPDHISRCKAVAESYKPEERNILATWSVHMANSKRPDRVAVVAAHVEAGHTSDEARKNPMPSTAVKTDWLLAVDVNYFIHSYFHSGAGVEAATTFDQWLGRLLERLQRDKGLTDCVCCFDGRNNHRKKLTEGWESQYKPRAEKDHELSQQLNLAPELLKARGLPCVVMDEMEADDLMASYAVQFPGRVTLLTKDKDMRQCLSPKCNMLTEVDWQTNEETGDSLPFYKWVSAKQHIEDGCTYSGTKVSGITPEQWPHFQAIAGDSSDGIKGCEGIGAKVAMDLIQAHGTIWNVMNAASSGRIALTKRKLEAVLEFEAVAETTLKLVTLRTDLAVPMITKLCLKETVCTDQKQAQSTASH